MAAAPPNGYRKPERCKDSTMKTVPTISLTLAACLALAACAPSSPPANGAVKAARMDPAAIYTYDPLFDAWCVFRYGCVPENQIPPDHLRKLRAAAGLDPEAPVYVPPAVGPRPHP